MATYKSISDAMRVQSSIIESMNRSLEPIRQINAITENIRRIHNQIYSSPLIRAAQMVNSSVDMARSNAFKMNEIVQNINRINMKHTDFISNIHSFNNSITGIKSNALIFNNANNMFNQTVVSFSGHVYVQNNIDVIRDHNIKQRILDEITQDESINLNDQISLKLIQIAYSQEIINVKVLKKFMNELLFPMYTYLLTSSGIHNEYFIYLHEQLFICMMIINLCTFTDGEDN